VDSPAARPRSVHGLKGSHARISIAWLFLLVSVLAVAFFLAGSASTAAATRFASDPTSQPALMAPATNDPAPMIVDTDIFSDADDVGALATAFGLQIRGEANVIAIGVNTRLSRPAVATNSWKCAAAVAQFYNSGGVPIGTDMPNNGTERNTVDFVKPCARLASSSTPTPDTAVSVFRRALAGQADGSVVMVGTGYTENLSDLLNSPPDAISPLSGHDLIAQKVETLVQMGGGYPSRNGETNLSGNPPAAQDVSANWPTKIVWSGVEVGDEVRTGNTISSIHPTSSPVRVAYEAFVGPNNWIYSYDLAAVYHAIRPADSLLTEVGPGTNSISGTGANTFTTGAGNQYYLTLTNATSLDAAIEALLDTLPGPPDTAPPVISAVGASSITPNGASISWTTDEASDSQIEYGTTTAYGSTTTLDASRTVSHSQALGGLVAATLYHYRVKSKDAAGNLATSPDFTFTTASPPSPGTIEVRKVIVPGDDPGRFDLQVDGVTEKTDASDGDTTGPVPVATGTNHSVGELAGTETSLSDYSSSISCTRNGAPAESGSGTSLAGITANPNDVDVCTITNTRVPYVRPKGASPIHVPLTPAYEQCTVPDSQHGGPLSYGSCNPPQQASGQLTVGTPDANGRGASSRGSVLYRVVTGDPDTPSNEADVRVEASLTDVRRQGTLADYGGELLVEQVVQITDRFNGSAQDESGTVQASAYLFAVPCAATTLPTVGGSCSLSSTFNAILPGSVVEGGRSIWELGQTHVFDGGADGIGATTGDNTLFATQGIFVP
jgi:purine nucleosidase